MHNYEKFSSREKFVDPRQSRRQQSHVNVTFFVGCYESHFVEVPEQTDKTRQNVISSFSDVESEAFTVCTMRKITIT